MKAMVLGAGLGSRLDPLTRSVPKPMVPVVGKPVLGHILDHLRQIGVRDVIVNAQYLNNVLAAKIGDGSAYGVNITLAIETELCGDAGGLKRVQSFFDDGSGEPFLVIGGDDLTDIDLEALVRFHIDRNAVATMPVKRVSDTSQFGIAVVGDDGLVHRFQEKPKPDEAFSNLANTGMYVFSPEVFSHIPEGQFYGVGNNVLPDLLSKGLRVAAMETTRYWMDVGNIAVYRQAQRDVIDGLVHAELPHGAQRVGDCVICKGAVVEGTIEDHTVVGHRAVIEKGAIVRNSILWDDAVVKSGTTLENCIVGEGVTVSSTHTIFGGNIVEGKR